MRIRPATYGDIRSIARIGAAGFAAEPIYAHFFPHRAEFPQDYFRFFKQDALRTLVTPGRMIAVAEKDENEPMEEDESPEEAQGPRIVAYATLVRVGSAEEMAKWNRDSWVKKLIRALLHLYEWALPTNRAVSHASISTYYRDAAAICAAADDGDGDDGGKNGTGNGHIEFKTLAVDPAHQRRGYGEQLVEYYGMRAWEEDLPVYGDATAKGLPLYLRNGCEDIGKIRLPKLTVQREKENGESGLVNVEIEALEVTVLKWKA